MATERQISMNYNQAKNCASELEDEADKLRKLADSEFASSIAEIQTAWKGENAELYVQKCEQLKEEMLGTAKTIASIASGIRTNAQAVYDAEMENLRILQKKAAEGAKKALETITNTTPAGKTINSAVDRIQGKVEAVRAENDMNSKIEMAEEVMEDAISIAKNTFKFFK